MELIGLSGYARAGKDTAAQVLNTDGWQRIAFADVLRDFLARLDPVIADKGNGPMRLSQVLETWGWDGYKETIFSGEIRGLLQRLGTECGRQVIGENVWVDAAFKDLDPDGRYAISDCRFLNEAEAVRSRGGKVIRIERPGIGPANSHASETSLDAYDFDAVIVNDDSHEVLRQRLVKAIYG